MTSMRVGGRGGTALLLAIVMLALGAGSAGAAEPVGSGLRAISTTE